MAYLEFEIPTRSWNSSEREILLAKMFQIGFEGFVESEEIIQAYIVQEQYSGDDLNQMVDELLSLGMKVQYRFHETEDQNWNEEWKKKFNPVIIGDLVLIRAPFHDASRDLPCTIIIEPKMSFGTGHHYTTRLMIIEMMKHDMRGSRVLDMGCGTGVLGICACMQGAERVLGVDHDQWAYENALENVDRNGATMMEVRLGDVNSLGSEVFDIVLANITRKTLVQDMPEYTSHLVDRGILIVSGILAEDVQYVLNAAYQCGLSHLNTIEESNWLSLSFVK
ncbi:MAG: 50S ribosomal protein L11 methyltransferase [Bacteroidales bacterium]|nr:50S ribosomal protein L11 methyltransferase [Bacteroidales bacterium]